MDNSKYFLLSGFISLTFFCSVLFGFAYILFDNLKIKTYGLEKKNYISVSIELPTPKAKTTQKKKKASAPTSVTQPTTKKIEDLDVNDLFSDVWTQKIDHKKKPKKDINSKRLAVLQKKLKKTKENKIEKISEKIESEEFAQSQKNESLSSAHEVNEYLAKIQALVYHYFHVPPNTQGNSVKTVIELDPYGKVVDFRVLEYSSNTALNEEVDKIKKRLFNVIFPKNPKNEYSKTIVILISKE